MGKASIKTVKKADRLAKAEALLQDLSNELAAFSKGRLASNLSPSGDAEELFGPFRVFEFDGVGEGEAPFMIGSGTDDNAISWPNLECIRQQIDVFLRSK